MAQANPIRLSHSSRSLLLTCERKFQLEKLLVNDLERDETEHTVFGTAFGTGAATYLVTQDKNLALYEAWKAYFPEIETDAKNQGRLIAALECAFPKWDTLLMNYEVVEFNGKPATELSFRLNINPQMYYVGYIDAVLRHRVSGVHVVFECKHTGSNLLDISAMYKNSDQALGYSVALDKIVGESLSTYGVLYSVAQLTKDYIPKIHILEWTKTLNDRLNWFIGLGLDAQRLEQMMDLNVFPKRGESCVKYNKICKHFGTCNLHSADIPKVIEPDETAYDFTYDLDSLIADHIQRTTTLLGA